ncbi:MAG: Gfo/Idh/MocA family oxidoreductase [Acidobacteria bacterium]|nr:Gfo/Idh/MocA family oxidoreductase [Acidobacteriota bacterium]
MDRTIRTGVVGFGLAGKVFHCPFVQAVPGLELAAIVQRKGDEAAQAYPQATIYRSLDDLLVSDVKLVVVGTPNATHYEFAKAAIQAGKHVVVDKPVTANSTEAAELADLAQKHGVLYAPFHNRRFDGDFLTAKSIIESGQLGRIVWFESHFDRFRPIPRANSWKEDAGDLQSLVLDLGPHLADQALALFGRPKFVTAHARTEREGSAIEDAFDIQLDFGGTQALLRASIICADPAPRFLIHGTGGSFRKYGLDPQEPAIINGAKVPPVGDDSWLTEDESQWGTLSIAVDLTHPAKIEKRAVPTVRGDYRNFYLNVRDTILGKASLIVTPQDATRTMRILELARKSAHQKRTLPIEDKDWN